MKKHYRDVLPGDPVIIYDVTGKTLRTGKVTEVTTIEPSITCLFIDDILKILVWSVDEVYYVDTGNFIVFFEVESFYRKLGEDLMELSGSLGEQDLKTLLSMAYEEDIQ